MTGDESAFVDGGESAFVDGGESAFVDGGESTFICACGGVALPGLVAAGVGTAAPLTSCGTGRGSHTRTTTTAAATADMTTPPRIRWTGLIPPPDVFVIFCQNVAVIGGGCHADTGVGVAAGANAGKSSDKNPAAGSGTFFSGFASSSSWTRDARSPLAGSELTSALGDSAGAPNGVSRVGVPMGSPFVLDLSQRSLVVQRPTSNVQPARRLRQPRH